MNTPSIPAGARRSAVALALAALLTATFGAPFAAMGHHDPEHTLAHALHNSPGNTIATPLFDGLKRVGGDNTSTGGHVVHESGRLYVGAYGLGMRFFSLEDPESPRLIGHYMPGIRADAVPDAAVLDGKHIVTLNGTRRVTRTDLRTDRTEFLDATNPASPRLLWTFVGAADGEAHNGDIADARRWWIPSGGLGVDGLRIYDLGPLLGSTPAAPVNLFRGDPRALWDSSPYRQGRPVGNTFTHTHDVEIYLDRPVRQANGLVAPRDILLLAEGGDYPNNGGNTGSLFVIDITNPRAPVVLNRWLHAAGDGHHPIRYHHEAQFLDGDPNVVLVTDEDLHNGCGGAGGITAIRVSDDLTRVERELSEWFIPAGTPAPVCSVHVFSSEGALVFLGSYNAGLQVVDYSDPANPQQAAYYIAPGTTAWGALVLGEHIYVGDMTRGLDVFELDDQELLPKLKLKKLLP